MTLAPRGECLYEPPPSAEAVLPSSAVYVKHPVWAKNPAAAAEPPPPSASPPATEGSAKQSILLFTSRTSQ